MQKIKLKITETRTTIVEWDPMGYPPEYRSEKGIITYETAEFYNTPDYMDQVGADSKVDFEVVK